MPKSSLLKCTRSVGTAVFLLSVLAGCNDDAGTEPVTGPAAQVAAIRLSVGTQTVTIYKDGKVTLGPLSFLRPNVAITATLLDARDTPIANVDPAQLQVNMGQETGSSNNFSFTRSNAFGGTLAATAAGTFNFGVSLFDVVKRRTVFGPYNIPVVAR